MTFRRLAFAPAIVALLVAPAVFLRAQQPPGPPVDTSPQTLDVPGGRIRVVTVASGLLNPWSFAFLPDGRMLVTERNGRLRVIRDGVLLEQPAWTAPPPAPVAGAGQGGRGGRAGDANPARGGQAGQGGRGQAAAGRAGQAGRGGGGGAPATPLYGLAVHPQFAKNGFVYLAHPKQGERGTTLAISRGRLEGDSLTGVTEIFAADAWETGGNMAGRLLFGPDATLYVTVGDRDRLCCTGTEDNSLRMKAQDLSNHVGKTLRIRDDGGVPKDNPFVGRAGAKPEIFTYGHRNGYGLAFHPETGELWQAEIGPMGGDEVNILLPGHNYGWPIVSTGRNYTGSLVSDQPWARPGMDNPRIHWVPSISPSSIMFYTGDKFPRWKNSLFVGALTTRQLLRIGFNQPSQAEPRQGLLVPMGIRPRDVQQGPDGFIYVATERSLGGNAPDGTILRIEPAP